VTDRTDTATRDASPSPRPEPRQRWRLVLARGATAVDQTQRELAEAWEGAIVAAALPVAWSDAPTPRPRISFGAPLSVGMAAEAELIDIVLTERWPMWRVREALDPFVPAGWRVVRLEDVWLAGPPLAGRVAAADYRMTLLSDPPVPMRAIEAACTAVLAAPRLPRERVKGGGTVVYDLRPLVIDVRVADGGPPLTVVARTRFHPELGTGRPEEVVAAVAERAGVALAIGEIVRERLLLADDLD
jgi:radical SAM-linked protein